MLKKKAALSIVYYGNVVVRLSCIQVILGTLVGQRYVVEVFYPHILMICQTVENNFSSKFQQDNARIERHCLQVSHVNTIDWPPKSHDLTPIEHLWDILCCQVCALYPFPSATWNPSWLNNGNAFHREICTGFFYACTIGSQNALIKVEVIQDNDLQ